MYRRFCNITMVSGDRLMGFQVKVGMHGELYQPYIPGFGDNALRAAIETRNGLWQGLQTTARGILLLHMAEPPPEPRPEDQIHARRAKVCHQDITRMPEPREAYVVQLRQLKTRRKTVRRVYIDEFFREDQALAHALHLRDSNRAAYNTVVDIYNQQAFERAMRAADVESSLLTPRVYLLREFTPTLWATALKRAFPTTSHKRLTTCPTD